MSLSAILHSRPSRVVTVPMTNSLQSAMTLMRTERVDAVPVIDRCATEGEVVLGLLTRRAVFDALTDHGPAALAMKVADLIDDGLVFCDIGEGLPALITRMRERAAHHVVVMDREQAIGVIDVSDILFFSAADVAPPVANGPAEMNASDLRIACPSTAGAMSGAARDTAELVLLPVDFAPVIHHAIDVSRRSARRARPRSRDAPQLGRTPMEKVAQLATLKVEPLDAGMGLRRLACDAIKHAITEMNIYDHPEEIRLDERQLSRDLGVSRTPIREALSLLEQEGFVRSVPRRGIYIVRKNKSEIIEMITVWAAIESMAARLACERATRGGARRTARISPSSSIRIRRRSSTNMRSPTCSFTAPSSGLSGCALMSEIVDGLFIHMRAIRSVTMRQGDRAQRSIVDHMNIVTALENRDPELAARRIREHTLGLAEHIKKYGDFLDQFQSAEPRKRSYA